VKAEAKRGLLVSDFNLQNLSSYLNSEYSEPCVEASCAPYGQVTQVLLDGGSSHWSPPPDFVVVWTRPEGVITSFRRLLGFQPVNKDDIWAEVDRYCEWVCAAAAHTPVMLVSTWYLPAYHQGHGMLSLKQAIGPSRLLLQMNLRLLENLDPIGNIHVLDVNRWLSLATGDATNPRLWYLGKIPLANDAFKIAARDIKAALRGLAGRTKKLIVVDLDETLWGGVVGDVGWENIVLGGPDPAGEALVDFQRELKALARRGILLAVVSKNEEFVALEALERHPEMVLRPTDFAGWRIDWKDKAANIADLVRELNLGLESVVFIDDNPVERNRVRSALPEVLVPDWPIDKRFYPAALNALDCFDMPALSAEDRERSALYGRERERAKLRQAVASVDEWLGTLEIVVVAAPLTAADLRRAAQLLNKTNQMNLSTRRLTEVEFASWAAGTERHVWTIRVSDRFGDSGLTGIISVERDGRAARVVDFVLSCRVMGRKVEEAMLHVAAMWAKGQGMDSLCAVFRPTAKNKPCLAFFEASGWKRSDADTVFELDLGTASPAPDHVKLQIK